MSFVSPTVQKMGGTPSSFPCGNTVAMMEAVEQNNFIDNAKKIVFSRGKPTTISMDAVKKTGCGGRKIVPLHATTVFGEYRFGIFIFCILNNKHGEKATEIAAKRKEKAHLLGIKQLTWVAGDTASSETKSWQLTRESDIPHAEFSVFVPDLPHGGNSSFSLAAKMLCGSRQSYLYRQSLISYVLCHTKKRIEGSEDSLEYALSF